MGSGSTPPPLASGGSDPEPPPTKPSEASTGGPNSQTAAAAAAGVGQAGQTLAASTNNIAESYSEIAARYAEEKRRYLDLLMDLQAEQREALGAIAQYAEQMKIAEGDSERAKAAVDSLQQAVAALKQIVTVLETAKLFWEMMARACARLASTEIKDYVALFAEDEPEDRLAEYMRDDFKSSLLQLAARWCALGMIAEEYQTGVAAAREQVLETINKAPSIEAASKLAPALAGKLKLDVDKDLLALAAATEQLMAEQAELA